MTITLCAEDWQALARVTFTTPKKLVSICSRKSSAAISSINLRWRSPRYVTSKSEPAKGIYCALDGIACCACVGHVECNRPNLTAVAVHQISQLCGLTRCGHELISGRKDRFGQRPPKAAAAASDQPNFLP